MSLAIYPGSFDPITLGHVDVVRRARTIFSEVVVLVGQNNRKSYMFDDSKRLALAEEALASIDGVRVDVTDGLIVDYARRVGANAIVKGIRGGSDFDSEQPMALMNRHMSGIETVFLLGDPALTHVASSFVKEVASFGGNIDDLVPANVARAVRQAVKEKVDR